MVKKRRVLVTGANGFIGTIICKQLVLEGYSVVAATRKSEVSLPDCRMVVVGSVGAETDWSEALIGVSAVIHLVGVAHTSCADAVDKTNYYHSVNALGTLNLAEQCEQAGVKNFVFMSSIKVNGEKTVGVEDCMTASRSPAPENQYGISKYEAEKLLITVGGMSRVILRPPLVFGPGQKGNLDLLCRALLKRIPLPLRNIENKRSLIYVENLGGAAIASLGREGEKCEIFTIADASISTTELVVNLARNLRVSAILFYIPKPLLKLASGFVRRRHLADRLLDSLLVDSEDARRTLKWSPKFSFDEGLRKTSQWYRDD